MKNIEELNATIEELEKRIKAISSAGATLAQIIAVRDSLEQVKVCLNNLTTAIKDEEDDASVAQLTALEQRVTTAETDITTLQTDLTSTQDDLETVWNNLASTNNVVGEHTTTLTNLQTAQTNLQTTQTNQASTITTNTTDISNLKTRMTTAENNISTLTGSVALNNVEPLNSTGDYAEYNIAIKCNNSTINCSPIYIYNDNLDKLHYNLKCFFKDITGTSSFNLSVKINNIDILTKTVTFANTNEEIDLDFARFPMKTIEELKIYVTTTSNINFYKLIVEVDGKNVAIINKPNKVNIQVYNNKYYVSYSDDTYLYFDEMTQENLTLSPTEHKCNLLEYYKANTWVLIPRIRKVNGVYTQEGYYLIGETFDNCLVYHKLDNFNATFVSSSPGFSANRMDFCIFADNSIAYTAFMLKDDTPRYFKGYSTSCCPLKFNGSNITDKCIAIYGVSNNYVFNNTTTIPFPGYLIIKEDGIVYYYPSIDSNYYIKLRKGFRATAYLQTNNNINVYISYYNKTFKYTLTLNNSNQYQATFIKEISNCQLIVEGLNNTIFKYTQDGIIIENN